MEKLFKLGYPSRETQFLLERTKNEAFGFRVSEIDSGHLAIATLDDKKLRHRYELKVDLPFLRSQLLDISGYIAEYETPKNIAFTISPAVFLVTEYAEFLATANGKHNISPDMIFQALNSDKVGGIGNVLFRRAGIVPNI